MKRKTLLYAGGILAVLLSGLNILGLKFYLYWPKDGMFGFDSFMHFLGGVTLGVLAVWFFKAEKRSWGSFFTVLAAVIFLGGVWEIFEHLNEIAVTIPERYWPDTIHDLVLDTLGGATAYLATTTSQPRQPF